MKLFISERLLTLRERTAVTDENGEPRYYVHGDFVIAKKYYVDDLNGNELASVVQKMISSTGTCIITRNGNEIAEIVPKITLVKPKYAVKGLDWSIEGNFSQNNYVIKENGAVIVNVVKIILTKGNSYEIDISDGIDEVNALACVLMTEGILELNVINTAVQTSMMSNQ